MNTIRFGFEPLFTLSHEGKVCGALVGYCDKDADDWGDQTAIVMYETGEVCCPFGGAVFNAEEKAEAMRVGLEGCAASEEEKAEYALKLMSCALRS